MVLYDILGKTRKCVECDKELLYKKGYKCKKEDCLLCKHVFTCSKVCHDKRLNKVGHLIK